VQTFHPIQKSPLPAGALLNKFNAIAGAYTDCYFTEIPAQAAFAEYVFAFYTTPLFKLERLILKLLVRKPSTNEQARELAYGICDSFAAWTVEDRGENQLMMCDFVERTRSWLMVVPAENGTRLYFGSAVVPVQDRKTGKPSLGFLFRALLGFHKIYSVLLLYSAGLKLMRQIPERG
jgi:hypothetical protein